MTTKKKTNRTSEQKARPDAGLDSRYGKIGISAVAAALQFKCEAKNPAYAPADPQPRDEKLADIAA